jgi:choline monooxygenase
MTLHGPHRTAPAAHYRDPERFQVERRRIFGATWQFVGHERDLTVIGDVVTAMIAGYPVLAVRTADGLKAFHNVCRHRAGPLFDGDKGNCGQALTCKYHGWVYALDGRLRNARDFGAAKGFDPRDFSLLPVRVETWRGFVFVNLNEGARPLAAHLAPLEARMAGRDLTNLVPAGRKTHDIACNWKIYAENYLEGYHIPPVHPVLDAEIDSAKYQVTVEGDVCFHSAPMRDAAANAVYDGLWAFVAPNLGVNLYGHGLMMEHMMPFGHDRTRLIYDYFLKPEIAADASEVERIMAMSATVTAEDKWICEKVQENIDAGIYDTGVLSPRHEEGVAWFQRMTGAVS